MTYVHHELSKFKAFRRCDRLLYTGPTRRGCLGRDYMALTWSDVRFDSLDELVVDCRCIRTQDRDLRG